MEAEIARKEMIDLNPSLAKKMKDSNKDNVRGGDQSDYFFKRAYGIKQKSPGRAVDES